MNILDNYGESEYAECILAVSQPPQTVKDGAIESGNGNSG